MEAGEQIEARNKLRRGLDLPPCINTLDMDDEYTRHYSSHGHKRSRSPRNSRHSPRDVKRIRSRSPHRHHHHHGHGHGQSKPARQPAKLPFGAHQLHKQDLNPCRQLFAEYLSIQKQLDISTLSDDELKGRWKSFLGKWNRGELAEGWYDPETRRRAERRTELGSLGLDPHGTGRVSSSTAKPVNDDGYGATSLPHGAQPLHARDQVTYHSLFMEYLDVEKRLSIHDLKRPSIHDLITDQLKDRWNSFLAGWNRGELAEGWYDPETKRKADTIVPVGHQSVRNRPRSQLAPGVARILDAQDKEDDEYGPALPDASGAPRVGPAIPTLQDLQYKRELAQDDDEARRADLRHERKLNRKIDKERLEDLAPRADPGSRERQLEKKREITATNRTFAQAKDSCDVEVGESELMGEDGIEGYKAKLKAGEKRKNERETRKEEVLRARAAEREEISARARAKEDKTMEMLRGLARERYGSNN